MMNNLITIPYRVWLSCSTFCRVLINGGGNINGGIAASSNGVISGDSDANGSSIAGTTLTERDAMIFVRQKK